MKIRPLQVGDVTIDFPVLLAPMAGVTDLPFRTLCHEQGCELAYSEMVSAKAVLYKNRNSGPLLQKGPGEGLLALQLFGSDPEILGRIAAELEDGPYAWIDLNMGCPVPKVVNNGEGSALMKDPARAEAILSSLVRHVKKPVTVKIRAGFTDRDKNAVEIARIAESCGVSAIAVHGRTREQYYAGQADWQIIRQVREAVRIPVLGNGDVFTPQDAEHMFAETGCDGILVGRGAKGNPWIFAQIRHYLETGEVPARPDAAKVRETIRRHLLMQIEAHGEKAGIREMRSHVAWYTAGFPDSSRLRNAVNMAETREAFLALIDQIRDR